MKKITIPKLSLIVFCVSGLIILGDALPGLTQSNLEMPVPGLEKYNEPSGSDTNGNPTYNGCGGVSNCFPTDATPAPSPSSPPTPSPPPAPAGRRSWKVVASNNGAYQWEADLGCRPVGDAPVLKNSGDGYVNYVWSSDGTSAGGWGDNTTAGNSPSLAHTSIACPGDPPAPDTGTGGTGSGAVGGGGAGTGGSGTGGSGAAPGAGSGTPASAGGAGDKPGPKNGEDDKGYKSIKPNFIAYGMKILSRKFPFDVFGSPGAAGDADVCPNLEILDKKFQLCIILDALKILKIPTIIAFIIWSIQSL